MIWEKIRGHADRVEMFRRSLGRGRLSHAYLFAGPGGIGKRLFARAFAQCLFCERFADADLEACGECHACRMMAAGTHPDHLDVGVAPGKKELAIEQLVGSRENRGREGLCHELFIKPVEASRRFAVIDDADRISFDGANAILKALEEPPAGAVIVLIAENADALLPTIRSRCQTVRFSRLPDADAIELLVALEWAADRGEAESIAALCEGSLDVAQQLLQPGLRKMRETIAAGLSADRVDGVALARTIAEGLQELPGASVDLRRNAGWLARFCLDHYRRIARTLAGAGAEQGPARDFAARLDADSPETLDRIAALFDRVAEAERQFDRAANWGLAVESLFLDLERMHAGLRAGAAGR
jgi:DNA polymerase-3 subunit delta'